MSSLDFGTPLGRSEMKKIMAGSWDCDDPDYCVCWKCKEETPDSQCYRSDGNFLCQDGSTPECCGTCDCGLE